MRNGEAPISARDEWVCIAHRVQVPLNQLLKPWVSVEASEPGSWGNNIFVRLGVGAALGGILYVLYTHSPDTGMLRARMHGPCTPRQPGAGHALLYGAVRHASPRGSSSGCGH